MGALRTGARAAALAITLAITLAAAVTAETAAPVVLSCTGAAGVPDAVTGAVCDALAETLAAAAGRQVLRAGALPGPPPGALEATLTVLAAAPHRLTAQLSWRQGERGGASPALAVSAQDAPLSGDMYVPLARSLLIFALFPV